MQEKLEKIINPLSFCTGFFQFSWKIDFENPNFIILEETLHGRFQKNIFDCLVKMNLVPNVGYHNLNTQYKTNPTIVSPVKMEYG